MDAVYQHHGSLPAAEGFKAEISFLPVGVQVGAHAPRWEQDAAGPNPATPAKNSETSNFGGFLLICRLKTIAEYFIKFFASDILS
jgi:hypothetical protein